MCMIKRWIRFALLVIWVDQARPQVYPQEFPGESPQYVDRQDQNRRWHIQQERMIVQYLAEKYGRYGNVGRAAFGHASQLRVMFGLSLIQVEIDEQDDAMKTSAWVRYSWNDQDLRWNRSEFGNVSRVILPSTWIWTPDVSLVNTAETSVDQRAADVTVHDNGEAFWVAHYRYKSACLIDVTNYPFDTQTCDLWFQSLSYNTEEMDIYPYEPSGFDLRTFLRDFRSSDEWQILTNETRRYETPGTAGGENLMFPRRVALQLSLSLRRRPGFTAYLLTLPCVVLGCMSVLVFILPPDRPDRHSVATALFGSFMLFLLILVQTAPPSAAAIPKLGFFYVYNICLIVLSFCLSSFVVNVHKRGESPHQMALVIQKVFLEVIGPCVLCRFRTTYHPKDNVVVEVLKESLTLMSRDQKDNIMRKQLAADMNKTDDIFTKLLTVYLSEIDDKVASMEAMLRKLVTVKHEDSKERLLLRRKWRTLASVLDRLFVIVYIILIIISLIFLLPRPGQV